MRKLTDSEITSVEKAIAWVSSPEGKKHRAKSLRSAKRVSDRLIAAERLTIAELNDPVTE